MSDETQNDNMEMVKLQTTLQQNVSDQKWREISTFEDAFALAQEMGAELVSAILGRGNGRIRERPCPGKESQR
jgi:sugar phosphate isomerase/epimerase